MAVAYPNQLNTAPGTVVRLTTLDPTKGMLVDYGSGTVSADGTKIIPDIDPATPGKRFGISNFDWHFPEFPPGPTTQPSPECLTCPPGSSSPLITPLAGDPIDTSSGLMVMADTDMALSGSRGTIMVRRFYRSLSAEAGPFGLGTSHNYGYRLDTRTPNTAATVNLIMPDGNRFALSRQDDVDDLDTVLVGGRRALLRVNRTVPNLQGAVLQAFDDGLSDIHWKDGTVFHFEPSTFLLGSVLTGITDANGRQNDIGAKPDETCSNH